MSFVDFTYGTPGQLLYAFCPWTYTCLLPPAQLPGYQPTPEPSLSRRSFPWYSNQEGPILSGTGHHRCHFTPRHASIVFEPDKSNLRVVNTALVDTEEPMLLCQVYLGTP
jgi:hypothetical protein